MAIAVYPGTFDPFTKGHLAVLKKASAVFDEIIVAVHSGKGEKCLFSQEERILIAEESVEEANIKNVRVIGFSSLLVEFLKKEKINNIIRGVRFPEDFSSELQMAMINSELMPEINVFFLPPAKEYFYLSSSRVRELAEYGADISGMVSGKTKKRLIKKINGKS